MTCRTDTPRRIPVTEDAFSECADGTVEMRKLPTARLVFARTGVYGAGGSLPLASMGLGGADSVLDASGAVTVDEATAAEGRVTITGRCMLNVICHTPDGITSGEGTMPVRLTLDAETPAGTEVMTTARLADLRARIDGAERALAQRAGVISALDPLGVLARGFSVTQRGGRVITSSGELCAGDCVEIRFSRGSAAATITEIKD